MRLQVREEMMFSSVAGVTTFWADGYVTQPVQTAFPSTRLIEETTTLLAREGCLPVARGTGNLRRRVVALRHQC
jgi:hypothetical protein